MFPKNMSNNHAPAPEEPLVSKEALQRDESSLLEQVSARRFDVVAGLADETLRVATITLQSMQPFNAYPTAPQPPEQWQPQAEPQVVFKSDGPFAAPAIEAEMPVYTGGNDDPSGLMTRGLEYATYEADPGRSADDAARSRWAASGNGNGVGIMHGSISGEQLGSGSDDATLMEQAAWVSGLKEAVQSEQAGGQEWATRDAYNGVLTSNMPPQQAPEDAARTAVAGAFGMSDPTNPYAYPHSYEEML